MLIFAAGLKLGIPLRKLPLVVSILMLGLFYVSLPFLYSLGKKLGLHNPAARMAPVCMALVSYEYCMRSWLPVNDGFFHALLPVVLLLYVRLFFDAAPSRARWRDLACATLLSITLLEFRVQFIVVLGCTVLCALAFAVAYPSRYRFPKSFLALAAITMLFYLVPYMLTRGEIGDGVRYAAGMIFSHGFQKLLTFFDWTFVFWVATPFLLVPAAKAADHKVIFVWALCTCSFAFVVLLPYEMSFFRYAAFIFPVMFILISKPLQTRYVGLALIAVMACNSLFNATRAPTLSTRAQFVRYIDRTNVRLDDRKGILLNDIAVRDFWYFLGKPSFRGHLDWATVTGEDSTVFVAGPDYFVADREREIAELARGQGSHLESQLLTPDYHDMAGDKLVRVRVHRD